MQVILRLNVILHIHVPGHRHQRLPVDPREAALKEILNLLEMGISIVVKIWFTTTKHSTHKNHP